MVERIKTYIKEYTLKHGYSPSMREIGDNVGLSSTCSVKLQMDKLWDNGELIGEKGNSRAYILKGLKVVERSEDGRTAEED